MALSTSAPTKLKIALAGDVMLGRLVDQIFPSHVHEEEDQMHAWHLLSRRTDKLKELKEKGHKYVWGTLLPEFLEADMRIINLETSATTHPHKWPNKVFNYRMHPDNLKILKEANIDYCCLANNHTLDYNVEGMLETMASLDAHGVKWAGVGRHKQEAERPAILECKGIKFACFSFSDHPSMWESAHNKPGINYLNVLKHRPSDVDRITALVQQYKQAHSIDVCVASIHWGSNYCWEPPQSFQKLAHDLIDKCGIDIIHGHSSHHIQGIEIYDNKPIIYGCGDFIDDYAVDEHYRNNLGFLYKLNMHISKEHKFCGVESIELTPTKISNFQVGTHLNSEEREWLGKMIRILSEPFGVKVHDHSPGQITITKG